MNYEAMWKELKVTLEKGTDGGMCTNLVELAQLTMILALMDGLEKKHKGE